MTSDSTDGDTTRRASRWTLLKRFSALRAGASLAVFSAIIALGLPFTLLMGMLPFVAATAFDSNLAVILALPVALLSWILASAAVGVGALRAWQGIIQARIRGGLAVVGRDGIAWRKWFRTRFLRWSDVRAIDLDNGVILVKTLDNKTHALRADDASGLLDAARAAREAYLADTPHRRIEVFERGDASLSEWVAQAKALLKQDGYRAKAPPAALLTEIAAAPHAPPTQRIAAALAVADAGEAHRVKVRVAIQETADPVLADALAEVLEGGHRLRPLKKALKSG